MKRTILALILILALTTIGCESRDSKKEQTEAKELLIYCAAGIRPPAAELAEVFGREHNVKIITDYAGSEVLLSKIKLVRRGDLYMPGDKHYVDQAAREDMIDYQLPVCYFVPTILVQKGNPKNIHTLQDLLRPGVKLGLGDTNACAIGRKTKKLLTKNNITWAQVEKNLRFQSQTVNELGMQIQAQSLDAVIVWDAMARYYKKHGEEIPIPTGDNIISTIEIGVLSFSEQKDLARQFCDFVTSARGREIFKKHNYTVDAPE